MNEGILLMEYVTAWIIFKDADKRGSKDFRGITILRSLYLQKSSQQGVLLADRLFRTAS